jgi:hypothetical protein
MVKIKAQCVLFDYTNELLILMVVLTGMLVLVEVLHLTA